jgi:4-amino-4-deoxy-L-arabinose transferase-like glycosyltransferase
MSTSPPTATVTPDRSGRKAPIAVPFRALILSILIVLGAIQAWMGRSLMQYDGVQYLDLGDAYVRHDWHAAANSYWSPMYAWLQGAALAAIRPSSELEFPVVHAVNFAIFLAVLAAFEFFLSTLLHSFENSSGRSVERRRIEAWSITLIGYAAFAFCTLNFTNLGLVTPDLLASVFVYIAAACLIRIMDNRGGPLTYSALGAAFGLGYLVKAPFLYYAILCLGLAIWLTRRRKSGIFRVATSAAAFLAIAAPYIAFISFAQKRLTTEDSGPLNVVWEVNGLRNTHARGNPLGTGAAIHPTRLVSEDPPVYEFDHEFQATYPPWFNPVYWNEGIHPRIRVGDFAKAFAVNTRLYAYWFHHRQLPLIGGLLFLALCLRSARPLLAELKRGWPLLAFALFPFAMYIVVTAQARYLAPFFALLSICLAAALVRASEDLHARVISSLALSVAVLMCVETCLSLRLEVPGPPDREIARQLAMLGLKPGDKVAITDGSHYAWARLAKVRVVSEVSFPGDACDTNASAETRRRWKRALEVLPATGAKFLVSPCAPGVTDRDGWRPLGETNYFAYMIDGS